MKFRINGVPQGSVLLFLVYINNLEDTVGTNILKFADDTKMYRKVPFGQDSHVLQKDLDHRHI